jgi:hypothetical protein
MVNTIQEPQVITITSQINDNQQVEQPAVQGPAIHLQPIQDQTTEIIQIIMLQGAITEKIIQAVGPTLQVTVQEGQVDRVEPVEEGVQGVGKS